jgi:membrane protein CcdC involved in cytochrome C biogenesis
VAKPIRRKDARRRSFRDEVLPLSKYNFYIIGIGLLVILAGYAAMLEGSVEGFLPLVVAPILLLLGYCVIIPLGILFKKSYLKKEPTAPAPPGKE